MTGTDIHIQTLVTERLILRAPRVADFEAYAATFDSPRAAPMGNLARRDAWYAFTNDVAGWLLHGFGQWSIDLKDGPHVGEVGLQHPDHFPEPEIGRLLHDGHQGLGYATEAARAALAWARDRVPSLVSYITPDNDSSVALAARLSAALDPAALRPDGEGPEETAVYRHWGAA
ncbi:MAG: GNAT family N-acetyltransferase [Pseudomonadota bacterium]